MARSSVLKRNRKRREKRRINWPANYWSKINWPATSWPSVFTAITFGVVLMTGHVAITWLMNRPIDSILVTGAFQRVSAIEIEEALSGHVQTGLMSADLHAMQAELAQMPWVASASVRRQWPGSVEVRVTEQYPAACWGERGLLNVAGELFIDDVAHVPVELPRLNGPQGSENRVAAMYFRIQEQLEQRGMAAISLNLNGRGAWEFQMNNGIRVRLGANAIERRIERFFIALDHVVVSQTELVDYIDMRYANGFALGWKDGHPMRAGVTEDSGPNV